MNDDAFKLSKPLLQVMFTPRQYQAIISRYSHLDVFSGDDAGNDYWDYIPSYIVSRCPLCFAEYTAQLDTHGLEAGWSTHTGSWNSIGYEGHESIGCNHIVASQQIVNLNGLLPTELNYYENELDVPFIMPPFVSDVNAAAVVHSVPICRIEADLFVPRYSAFFMVYYAEDPEAIRTRRADENLADGANDPEYYPSATFTASEAHGHPEAYDLALWVLRQKLYWLDPTTPDLRLRTGNVADFPYAGIEGYRRSFTIRQGKLSFGM
jgi:hypothetical protein